MRPKMKPVVSVGVEFPMKGMKNRIRGKIFNKSRRCLLINIQPNKILSLRQWKIGNSTLNGCTCSIK